MEGVGDVARGIDAGHGGAQPLVGEDAVVDLEARGLGESGVGDDTDAADDRVRVDAGAVGQQHAVDGARAAGELGDLYAEPQVHTVVVVQVREDLGDLAAKDTQQWQFGHLQHGDFHAGGAGCGSGLQADPAGPDDRHS